MLYRYAFFSQFLTHTIFIFKFYFLTEYNLNRVSKYLIIYFWATRMLTTHKHQSLNPGSRVAFQLSHFFLKKMILIIEIDEVNFKFKLTLLIKIDLT